MSLKSRCGLVAALLSILLLNQCGGQTELDTGSASGRSSTSTWGATGSSGITTPGGSAGLSGAGGTMNLPPCSVSASQYDNSCNSDSDCLGVPMGNPCLGGLGACSFCPTAALNVRVASQFLAALKTATPAQGTGTSCNCGCIPVAPCCLRGVCYNSCDKCNQLQ